MARFRVVRPWSSIEDKMLISLLTNTRLSMQAIGIKLNRTQGAVRTRGTERGLGSAAARKKAGLAAPLPLKPTRNATTPIITGTASANITNSVAALKRRE
jgi:hypothetical protein